MPAPTYDHDLTTVTNSTDTTGWAAVGGGGAGLAADPDFAMQGSTTITKQVSGAGGANKGMLYDNGSSIDLDADDHVWVWIFTATPGVTDTIENEGVVLAAGLDDANYNAFHVDGQDTFGAQGRVGKCYVVDYITSASTVSPYRTNYGTPTAALQFIGGKINVVTSVKGPNLGVDAVRYGTGPT